MLVLVILYFIFIKYFVILQQFFFCIKYFNLGLFLF